MPTYLLDAGVVVLFQRAGELDQLVHASRLLPMAIVKEVYQELTEPQPAKPATMARARVTRKLLDGSAIRRLELRVDSPGIAKFVELRGGRKTAHDRGEAASIALASEDPELVFVTADREGALLALDELDGAAGPRVERLAWFVRRLVEAGAVTPPCTRTLEPYLRGAGSLPSWWLEWASALAVPRT